jgi:hypothetical protein
MSGLFSEESKMTRIKKPKWKLEFLSEKEMKKLFGKRCKDQQPGCPVCTAWTRFDLINHMRWEDANIRIQYENDAMGYTYMTDKAAEAKHNGKA